jgi:aspartyl-tRNA synthetase
MQRSLTKTTPSLIGQTITVMGWVDTVRQHGSVNFVDIRDRSGILQVVGGKELKHLRHEDVVQITGAIIERGERAINPKIATGTVEMQCHEITVLSGAATLPFPIDTDGYAIDEEIRLSYRYLDLRRQRMAKNLRLRSQMTQFIRNYLSKEDFVEIETPILTKTTPEGARDFIVPSRLQPGNFYALPQSPQQYKQLLMVAGLERYFQIARCFRDEDPRKDRAYGEFTQLDLEMSFVTQEDILQLIEQMVTKLVETHFPEKYISVSPWPRLSHREVMEKYGTDKPDLRRDPSDLNELAFSWTIDFPLFTQQSETDFFHGSGQAKFAPSHHMFTAPHPDDIPLLDTEPTKVRGLQHDLVLNGFEVGGGSIRIHQREVQDKVFDLIGFTAEQKAQFNHMLTAFTYGVPPHGGIAPGIDRLLMVLLGEPSIREVMAFPTSASGRTAVLTAPSTATEAQLAELHIQVVKKAYASVYDHILDLLKSARLKHKLVEKETMPSVKSLILNVDDKNILYVIPIEERIDFKHLKTYFKAKKVQMQAKDVVETATGLDVKVIPPFGSSLTLPTYVSATLADNHEITFNAGRHDRSITMSYPDYTKVEKPTVIPLE